MGLDSVELLFEVESTFQVQISDQEASTISTIADISSCIAGIKNVLDTESESLRLIEQNIFFAILKATGKNSIDPDDKISALLHPATEEWIRLQADLPYKIPKPVLHRLFFRKPGYDWNSISVKNFIGAIIILNAPDIVDFGNPQSRMEIYYGVAGIISDHMDIDVFETKPEKKISTDLGIY